MVHAVAWLGRAFTPEGSAILVAFLMIEDVPLLVIYLAQIPVTVCVLTVATRRNALAVALSVVLLSSNASRL